MQRRMLAVAALASVAAVVPITSAQGATAKSKTLTDVVFGGVTAQDYPVVIELSKSAKKVVKATIGIELKCAAPGGDITVPDVFKDLPISSTGKFSYSYGPQEVPSTDPTSPVSKVILSGSITGKLNKARTKITGTWNAKIIAISAADPTGNTILDTCDSGSLKYTAKN
jgi:hypothetical protein